MAEETWPAPGRFARLLELATGPPEGFASETQRNRARRVALAALLLCVVWAAAAVLLPLTREGGAGKDAMVLTAILVAPAAASLMAYVLSRSQYTLVAAGAMAGVAAVGTLVAAAYHPTLAAPVSSLFLFASLLVLGVLFLPTLHAFTLAALNYAAALAIPHWSPVADARAIEVPYVFLGLNLLVFLVLAPLRHRDEAATETTAREARQNATLAHEHAAKAGKLAQASQLKDELLRVASHEVRSPLSVIALQLGLLRTASAQPFTPGQERSMAILERNVKRANALLETLLDKARLDAGGLSLRVEPLDVATLARETQEALGAMAAENGVAIELEAKEAPIRGDPLRISQVLYNLVGNAVKFTPPGGKVRVRVARVDAGARIEVIDSGAGMDEAQLQALFQPFGGVKDPPAGRKRGTGLGLAISRGLVERHGGRIWAESAGAGFGSTFTVLLPPEPPQEPPVASAQAVVRATPPEAGAQGQGRTGASASSLSPAP